MGHHILFYHRIFPEGPAPDVRLEVFDWQMRNLRQRFRVVPLDAIAAHARGAELLTRPSVAITFDDGWFDNYVYAYPVLKKYGLQATVFVSAGRMGDADAPRQTLLDYWEGRATRHELQRPGSVHDGFRGGLDGDRSEFLAWEELRLMERHGVVRAESHGMEHRAVFCGEEIVGFSDGDPGWMVRSATDDRRPGVSLYPLGSRMAHWQYRPDPQLDDHLAGIVAAQGAGQFFSRPGWEERLRSEVEGFRAGQAGLSGDRETPQEYRARVLTELVESRACIGRELGRIPVHFCWPWGEFDDVGVDLAREAGYSACYTTRPGTVTVGTDVFCLPRVSGSKKKVQFVKRSVLYSHAALSALYLRLSRR